MKKALIRLSKKAKTPTINAEHKIWAYLNVRGVQTNKNGFLDQRPISHRRKMI